MTLFEGGSRCQTNDCLNVDVYGCGYFDIVILSYFDITMICRCCYFGILVFRYFDIFYHFDITICRYVDHISF